MRNFLLIIIIGVIGLSCNKKGERQVNASYIDSIAKEKQRITLINDISQAKRIFDDYKSFWIPTANQLSEIDSILVKAIKEKNRPSQKRLNISTYKDYYRQYICCVLSNGDSIVYINAACSIGSYSIEDSEGNATRKRMDWQHNVIEVMDGGDCYWQVWINYFRKNYKYLTINGLAKNNIKNNSSQHAIYKIGV